MATISLCMIVRDEEAVLGRCLESVKDAVDEIIIVDTGSTDRTKEIAEQYTSQLFTFQWVDNFAAARNFTFSKARMDYQMWLDADDVLMPEDAAALRTLKEELKADVVMMPYQVAFDSDGHPTMSYYRERLFKREKGFQWAGAVHETITPLPYSTVNFISMIPTAICASLKSRKDPASYFPQGICIIMPESCITMKGTMTQQRHLLTF